jgi:uncharacterized membrane protein YoaK (UPF0700 family)
MSENTQQIVQQIVNKVLGDVRFLLLPGLAFMVTLSWRDFINQYYNDHLYTEDEIYIKKLRMAVIITIITLLALYFLK